MPQYQKFPKREHLRHGFQFRRVYHEGHKVAGRMAVVYTLPMSTPSMAGAPTRGVGFVTGRRLGNAVVRNRARRLLRETYRLHRHELIPGVHMVIVARSGIVGRKLADVEKDLLVSFRAAGLLAQT